MIPFPSPDIRKECTKCYTLLNFTYWEYNTNIEPRYMMGRDTLMFHTSNPTLTVKAFCSKCMMEINRDYIYTGDRFILISESYYQDSPMRGRDLISV